MKPYGILVGLAIAASAAWLSQPLGCGESASRPETADEGAAEMDIAVTSSAFEPNQTWPV